MRVGIIIMMVLLAVGAGGCTSAPPEPPTSPSPMVTTEPPISQKHMTWVAVMCSQTQNLVAVKTRRPDPRYPEPIFSYMAYTGATAKDLTTFVDQLSLLPELGNRAADGLVHQHLQEGQRVLKDVRPLATLEALSTGGEALQRRRANQVARVVASMKPPDPGLETVVTQEPILSRAYDRAPECKPAPAPTTPAPQCSTPTPGEWACEIPYAAWRPDLRNEVHGRD